MKKIIPRWSFCIAHRMWNIYDALKNKTHVRSFRQWTRADIESFVKHLNSRA